MAEERGDGEHPRRALPVVAVVEEGPLAEGVGGPAFGQGGEGVGLGAAEEMAVGIDQRHLGVERRGLVQLGAQARQGDEGGQSPFELSLGARRLGRHQQGRLTDVAGGRRGLHHRALA